MRKVRNVIDRAGVGLVGIGIFLPFPICINAYAAVKMLSPNHVRPFYRLRPSLLLTMVCRTGWFVDYDNLVAFESMIWFAVVLSFRRTIGFPNWKNGELRKGEK